MPTNTSIDSNKKKSSIKTKLFLYSFCIGVISLAVISVTFVAYDFFSYRENYLKKLGNEVETFSSFAEKILDKNSPNANELQTAMNVFGVNNEVLQVKIFNEDLQEIGKYKTNDSKRFKTITETSNTALIQGNYLKPKIATYIRDIKYNGTTGKVSIITSLEPVSKRMQELFIIMLIASSAILLIILKFSSVLSNYVLLPLEEILRLTKKLREDKNYSYRLTEGKQDEFGKLRRSLNTLFSDVERSEVILRESEAKLQSALRSSKQYIWSYNVPQKKFQIQTEFIRALSIVTVDENHISLEEFCSLLHKKDLPIYRKAIETHSQKDTEYFDSTFRINVKDEFQWFFMRGKITNWDPSNQPLHITGTLFNVNESKKLEEEIKLFKKVFDSTNEGVIVLDESFNIITANYSFFKITKFDIRESLGKNGLFFQDNDASHHTQQNIMEFIHKDNGYEGEIWIKSKDKKVTPIRVNVNSVKDNQVISNYVMIISDITHHKKNEDKLKFLANFDTLTQLPNRTQFFQKLKEITENFKYSNKKHGLLFCDLDHFKQINDTLGHHIGDKLLIQAAKRFKDCLRDSDIVARMGGDEFTILLDGIHSEKEIENICNKMLYAFSQSFVIESNELRVGVSIGAGIFPDHGDNIEELIKNADTAMYYSKEKGRNFYTIYAPELNKGVVEQLKLEQDLALAIQKNQLEIYYQPKLKISTKSVTGVEALIRWHHPIHGMLYPDKFIHIAEKSGLIHEIGKWVLDNSTSQLKQWHEGLNLKLSLSVNISAFQFKTGDLAEVIAQALWYSGLEAEYLELEITESVVMENIEKSVLMLRVLKAMGIKISIDDFGTGYSALSYLKRFPIDTLKIDKSFIKDINKNQDDIAIITAIIAMAKRLNLKVVAEGVETIEQLEFLEQEKCDEFQGFYFSRAKDANNITELLSTK